MPNTPARDLGWGLFVLQILSIMFVYLVSGVPAIAIWGDSSTGAAASVASSMAGALVLAWFWLRREGAVAKAWNLSPPPNIPVTLSYGILATIAIIGWFSLGSILVESIGLSNPDVAQVLGWATQSQFHFILWIVLVAVFAAGIGEELMWRGFLMDRLERLSGLRGRAWLVILVQGVLFGLPHLYQGLGGVIITAFVGFGFGWLRYRCGGNLWACIIAHIAVDTIMLSLAYAQSLGMIPEISA